jgi:hypothetical protein
MTEHTVDATAEEIGAEVSTDLAPTHVQSQNLFHTDDPVEVITRASRAAEALKGVIQRQGLVSNIQGREHVRVEGWTTLGSMLGVVPVVTWTRRTEDGWEARVEARTLDGRVVGAAEAMCTKSEGKPWNNRPDYALRSMAQTRATSKALRGPLGFVVTLAGYEATPAEEMPSAASSDAPTDAQMKELGRQVKMNKPTNAVLRAMLDKVGATDVTDEQLQDGSWSQKVTKPQVSGLLDLFKGGVLPTGESDVPSDPDPVPSSVAEEAGDLLWSES